MSATWTRRPRQYGYRRAPFFAVIEHERDHNMLNSVLESLFGCSHRTTTFPLTPTRNMAARSAAATGSRQGAYVVCLDCGKEFGYDWHAMRIGDPIAEVRLPAQVSLSPANRQSRARIYS
jgi:hypothetical protein